MAANNQTPANAALARARRAQSLIEIEPLPVRDILHLLILAVVALAHAVVKLEDSSAGGR